MILQENNAMSIQLFKDATNLLYGNNTGDVLYEFAEEMCINAFDSTISPLIPIILTTAISPYNRFGGWYSEASNTIEIVRQHCQPSKDGIVPRSQPELLAILAHEFCHVYQAKVAGGTKASRGPHRCKSWYDSITLASPFVCGINIEGLCTPLKSVRVDGKVKKIKNDNSLTEPELTHWPLSIFKLVHDNDKRLFGRVVGTPRIRDIKIDEQ